MQKCVTNTPVYKRKLIFLWGNKAMMKNETDNQQDLLCHTRILSAYNLACITPAPVEVALEVVLKICSTHILIHISVHTSLHMFMPMPMHSLDL